MIDALGKWFDGRDWMLFWTAAGAVANFTVVAVAVGVIYIQRRLEQAERVEDANRRTIELLKTAEQAAWEIGSTFDQLDANNRSAQMAGVTVTWQAGYRVKLLRSLAGTLAGIGKEGLVHQMVAHATAVQYLLVDTIEVLRRYEGTADQNLLFDLLGLKHEAEHQMDALGFFQRAMNRKPGDPAPSLS